MSSYRPVRAAASRIACGTSLPHYISARISSIGAHNQASFLVRNGYAHERALCSAQTLRVHKSYPTHPYRRIGHLSLGIFDQSLEEPDDVMRRLLGVAGAVAHCRVRYRIATDDESILVRASFHLRARSAIAFNHA